MISRKGWAYKDKQHINMGQERFQKIAPAFTHYKTTKIWNRVANFNFAIRDSKEGSGLREMGIVGQNCDIGRVFVFQRTKP